MRSDSQVPGALTTEWQSSTAEMQAASATLSRRSESSRSTWEIVRLAALQLFMTFLVVTFLVPPSG